MDDLRRADLSEATLRRSEMADAMRADTDDDGLSDAREVTLSTNPDGTDTDGDSIPDGRELQRWDTDPTLQDYQPPEVTIHQARFGTERFHSEYGFSVTGPRRRSTRR